MLNGALELSQNEMRIISQNITTKTLLNQNIEIRREDLDSIENATNTIVHWFIDCHYIKQTNEFKNQQLFTDPNKIHHIEALIEASFESNPIKTKTIPTIKSNLITTWRSQHAKIDLPYVCNNKSQIQPNPNKVYGYFEANVTVFGNFFFSFVSCMCLAILSA